MPMNVGQRFLQHPENPTLDVARQSRYLDDFQRDFNSALEKQIAIRERCRSRRACSASSSGPEQVDKLNPTSLIPFVTFARYLYHVSIKTTFAGIIGMH